MAEREVDVVGLRAAITGMPLDKQIVLRAIARGLHDLGKRFLCSGVQFSAVK